MISNSVFGYFSKLDNSLFRLLCLGDTYSRRKNTNFIYYYCVLNNDYQMNDGVF